MLEFENQAKKKGFQLVIGVDEAGRGPLAGPVVAAAVYLKEYHFVNPIKDSKQLSPLQRENAFLEIYENASVGVGIMNEAVIDTFNILEATYKAMSRAIADLIWKNRLNESTADINRDLLILIDGPFFKTDLPYQYQTIIKGDSRSLSIACASIVAKVIRDRILNVYDAIYPQYGFRQHKGYPTVNHKHAIKKYGLSLIHRKTFNFK